MKVLMVCLGNICRSPLAHGIMEHLVEKNKLDWEVDSAGTGNWHEGEQPDSRSVRIAAKYGVDITKQRARQIKVEDLSYYDKIFVMDKDNLKNVRMLVSEENLRNKIALLDDPEEVQDPYFDDNLFEPVFQQVYKACENLLKQDS